MIPTDSEFSILYFVYAIVLLLIIVGLFYKKQKKILWIYLFSYSIYTSLMIYVFSDVENFSGGAH